MKRKLEVCAVAVFLSAGASSAQPDDWKRLMERGQMLERAASYAQAAVAYREAVRVAEFGAHDRRLLASLNSLGLAYEELGRFPESERYLRRALAMLDEADENTRTDRAQILANLSMLYREEGKIAKAEDLLRRVIAIDTIAVDAKVLPPDDARLMLARASLAELVLINGGFVEAEPLLDRSLAVFEKQPERWKQEIATILCDLGVVRQFQGRNGEALRLFQQAIPMLEAELGPGHPTLVRPLVNLARVYAAADRHADAGAVFRRAVEIVERSLGPEHPVYSETLLHYAVFLRSTGRKREAKSLEARAKIAQRDIARRDGVGQTIDASSFRP